MAKSKITPKIIQEHCQEAQKLRIPVSSGSRSSGSSTSMKEQAIKENMRLADLMAEASYMK